MKNYKTYSYRIYPNKTQQAKLIFMFGCSRFIYNKTVEIIKDNKGNKPLSAFDIQKLIVLLKKEEATKWLQEAVAQSINCSIHAACNAFSRFCKNMSGFPKFKKRESRQTLHFPQGVRVEFKNKKIKLPKLELVSYIDDRVFTGKLKTVTIVKTATGKYFAQLLVEENTETPILKDVSEATTIGIDMGLTHFLITSDGLKIDSPKYLHKSLPRIRLRHKNFSRKKKGSKNQEKARLCLAKAYEKVANAGKDFLHKVSKQLVCKSHANTIAIEDLSIKKMMKSKYLARSIGDASWGMFMQMLHYKAERYGVRILKIDRFAPSSKQCSCGEINKELKLKDRHWTCKVCNTTHDRDTLAANNIKRFALADFKMNNLKIGTVRPESKEACGDAVRPVTRRAASMKQEVQKVS